jgi:DNA recombination protein Rad52
MTPEQIKMLTAPLDPSVIVKPSGQFGPKGDYIEGWHAINEANRIFGFDGWSYTTELQKVCQATNDKGNIEISYICKCTLRVGEVQRQDVGYGSGAAKKEGDAHEGAVKEAVTDALKRCLRTFGNPFGLALYDKSRSNVGFATIDGSQISELQGMIEGYGFKVENVCKAYKIASLKEIPLEKFANVKASLNKKFDAQKAKEVG